MSIKIGINGLGRIGRMIIRSLIENNNKNLVSLEGKTHTSIIWSAGSYINSWLENYFQTK